jgi:hypothetical protein
MIVLSPLPLGEGQGVRAIFSLSAHHPRLFLSPIKTSLKKILAIK